MTYLELELLQFSIVFFCAGPELFSPFFREECGTRLDAFALLLQLALKEIDSGIKEGVDGVKKSETIEQSVLSLRIDLVEIRAKIQTSNTTSTRCAGQPRVLLLVVECVILGLCVLRIRRHWSWSR